MAWRRTDALPVDPVGRLHEKRVLRMQIEEVTEVAAHRPRSFGAVAKLPPLRPDKEEGRPGQVLPTQHGSRVELLVVESAGRKGERLVAIVERDGVRRSEERRVGKEGRSGGAEDDRRREDGEQD